MWGFGVSYPIRLFIGSLLALWYFFRFAKQKTFGKEVAFFSLFPRSDYALYWRYVRYLLDGVLLICFFLLLSGLHISRSGQITKTGIDIVFVLDISRSMLADDFTPNRLEVAKDGINRFIQQRTDDRVGLVVYSGKPFVSLPLTFDYSFITETVDSITIDTINQEIRELQGTATGEALLRALDVLDTAGSQEDGPDRSQIIILLTDGKVTPGTLDPLLVSKLAATEHVSMYTLGIGSDEGGSFLYTGGIGERRIQVPGVDEDMLQHIAKATDANYRRVTDEGVFEDVFDKLSQVATSELRLGDKQERRYFYSFFTILLLLLISMRLTLFILIEYPLLHDSNE